MEVSLCRNHSNTTSTISIEPIGPDSVCITIEMDDGTTETNAYINFSTKDWKRFVNASKQVIKEIDSRTRGSE